MEDLALLIAETKVESIPVPGAFSVRPETEGAGRSRFITLFANLLVRLFDGCEPTDCPALWQVIVLTLFFLARQAAQPLLGFSQNPMERQSSGTTAKPQRLSQDLGIFTRCGIFL